MEKLLEYRNYSPTTTTITTNFSNSIYVLMGLSILFYISSFAMLAKKKKSKTKLHSRYATISHKKPLHPDMR